MALDALKGKTRIDAQGNLVEAADGAGAAPAANTDVSGASMRLTPDTSGLTTTGARAPGDALVQGPTGGLTGSSLDLTFGANGAAAVGGLKLPGDVPKAQAQMPELLKRTVPDVKPFEPQVGPTMDSRKIAQSFSAPTVVPTRLQDLMRKSDEAAARGDMVAAEKFRQDALGETAAKGGAAAGATGAGAGAGATGTTEGPKPEGAVTEADIKALFPEQTSLADEYAALRQTSGIGAVETELAQVNKDLGDLTAIINNVESDLRRELGGEASKSFFEAAVADRIRTLKPEYDRLTNRQAALEQNMNTMNAQLLQQIGLSQNDIENKRAERNDVRTGVMDLINTFGSDAFSSMDPGVVAELERRGGFAPGTLSRGEGKTIAERQLAVSEKNAASKFQSVVQGGKLFSFDPVKGTYTDSGIVVPDSSAAKDRFNQYVELAKTFFDDPAEAVKFLDLMSGNDVDTASAIPATKKVGDLSDDELTSVLKAMAQREGYGADPNNRPTRNNNPLNIKYGGATKKWVDAGLATIEKAAAADGGNFLVFNDVATGLEAAADLIRSDIYSGLGLDAALRKWSGNGYGSDILPTSSRTDKIAELKGKAATVDLKLSAAQKTALAGMNETIRMANAIEKYVKDNKINVGPIAGRAGKLSGTLDIGADPKMQTLIAMTERMRAEAQRAISGAQMNEGEAKRFLEWLPVVEKGESKFFADLSQIRTGMRQKRIEFLSDPVTGKTAEGVKDIGEDDLGVYAEMFYPTSDELPFTATADGVTYGFPTQEMADQWLAAMNAK